MRKEIGILIQARLSSSRLPGKILFRLGNSSYNSLSLITKRLGKLGKSYKIIVLTTKDKCDDAIVYECRKLKLDYFRGRKHDVLDRFYNASKESNLKTIIRLTSDCPFVDPNEISRVLEIHKKSGSDYTTNSFENSTIIDGMDVEVFSFNALEIAQRNAQLPSEREHVTFYFTNNSDFIVTKTDPNLNYPYLRLTLDTPNDYECISELINNIDAPQKIGMREIAQYFYENNFQKFNINIEKNSGWVSSFEADKKFLDNK